jgi:hypothetical protein
MRLETTGKTLLMAMEKWFFDDSSDVAAASEQSRR